MKWLAILLLVPTIAFASPPQVHIDESEFVYNWSGTSCVWCSLDTLARHNNVCSIIGIGDRYVGPVYSSEALLLLEKEYVSFRANINNKSKEAIREFLIEPCRLGIGVVVTLDEHPPSYRHAVTLVHYDPVARDIRIVDSNKEKLEVEKVGWDYFHEKWTGNAIFFPDGEKYDKD